MQMWSTIGLVRNDPSADLSRSEAPAFQCPAVRPMASRADSFSYAQGTTECAAMNQKRFSDDLTFALELVVEEKANQQVSQHGRLGSLWSCCARIKTCNSGARAEEEDRELLSF